MGTVGRARLGLGAASGLLGLVWGRRNAFAEGVPFAFPSSPDTGPGLTAAGGALVRRCAERGVLVDLSHLNERGFWDVAALDAGPLVASHSGVHALCPASARVAATSRRSLRPARAAAVSAMRCPDGNAPAA